MTLILFRHTVHAAFCTVLWFCGRMDYVLVIFTAPFQVLLRLRVFEPFASSHCLPFCGALSAFYPLSYDQTVPKTQRRSNSMDQNPSSEPDSHWANQEIIRLSWNPKVHYLIPNSPPLVPIPSPLHLLHTLALKFTLILFCRLHKSLRRFVH